MLTPAHLTPAADTSVDVSDSAVVRKILACILTLWNQKEILEVVMLRTGIEARQVGALYASHPSSADLENSNFVQREAIKIMAHAGPGAWLPVSNNLRRCKSADP